MSKRKEVPLPDKVKAPDMGTTGALNDSNDLYKSLQDDYIINTLSVSIEKDIYLNNLTDAQRKAFDNLKKKKGRHFWFVVYEESASEDWIEKLIETGLSFEVSELHDKDVLADGVTPKKPHYHVIVSYPNTTTYNSVLNVLAITHSPLPIIISSTKGAYRYHAHKDNPDKYQYDTCGKAYNGWTLPLDDSDISEIVKGITDVIFEQNVCEYADLVKMTKDIPEQFDQVRKHTMYFNALCRSLRHSSMSGVRPENTIKGDDTYD